METIMVEYQEEKKRKSTAGENVMVEEYLTREHGEDVAASIDTPKQGAGVVDEQSDLNEQLQDLRNNLEAHQKEEQNFEYTFEKGVLYCLETSTGKIKATTLMPPLIEKEKAKLITKNQGLLHTESGMLSPPQFEKNHKEVIKDLTNGSEESSEVSETTSAWILFVIGGLLFFVLWSVSRLLQ